MRQRTSADFDLRTDVSVYRPSSGIWYVLNSSDSNARIQPFGLNDIPTPEDFDGDRVTDIGVYPPSTGTWYYYRSSDGTVGIASFGGVDGDIPTAADYDGDQKADLAVFGPRTGSGIGSAARIRRPYSRTSV